MGGHRTGFRGLELINSEGASGSKERGQILLQLGFSQGIGEGDEG